MFLRVRGNGASPENSQALLVHLRGFRLTNTRPPAVDFTLSGKTQPMIFSHFHVGVQVPDVDNNAEVNAQLCSAVWREIWNMYDIVYDDLCIFPPKADVTTTFFSSSFSADRQSDQNLGSTGYTQLTSRTSSQTPVVVTHYFPPELIQFRLSKDVNFGEVVVLDVSYILLEEAATKIAVEVAWLAAYASLRGVFDRIKHVVVRLPYDCIVGCEEKNPIVQEGLDFLAEHLTLCARDFVKSGFSCAVDVHFVGSTAAELVSTLRRLSDTSSVGSGSGPQLTAPPVVFVGDHHQKGKPMEDVQIISSSLGIGLVLELVPLKGFISGEGVKWDEATSRENQVLNFCPCCGHCGGH
ncbi:hypothetical protein, conserved [Trypanosoma brucei gambiense DAL972]|uniref:Uncharacterized protein n=1 Tax=Trypanosoma brucei gambiense (strain MHOM/CI/86/DAL972) TaxID=679716 RepID=C9ZUN4_TRYB9|nr:hypothetical protein, conserved [Trypanosoma brucei gambiense DAL972]CBH13122.1 hypothetical protein, conserved [Trypanosoma brucei gambiense DAL972]|eukprot:XP_011775399.1 hypothetical protein, conserved [Trypanosoma brucei gambiense DAL972]